MHISWPTWLCILLSVILLLKGERARRRNLKYLRGADVVKYCNEHYLWIGVWNSPQDSFWWIVLLQQWITNGILEHVNRGPVWSRSKKCTVTLQEDFLLLGTNFTVNVVLVRRVRFKVSPEIQTSISFNLNARKSRLTSCYTDRLAPERESYIEMTRIAI